MSTFVARTFKGYQYEINDFVDDTIIMNINKRCDNCNQVNYKKQILAKLSKSNNNSFT